MTALLAALAARPRLLRVALAAQISTVLLLGWSFLGGPAWSGHAAVASLALWLACAAVHARRTRR